MSARGGKSFVNTTSVQAGTARTKDHCAALIPVTFGGDSEALRTAHMSSATSSASAQEEKTTPTRRSSACGGAGYQRDCARDDARWSRQLLRHRRHVVHHAHGSSVHRRERKHDRKFP